MEDSKARVYSGKSAAHVRNMQRVNASLRGCVNAPEMARTIGVADPYACFVRKFKDAHACDYAVE